MPTRFQVVPPDPARPHQVAVRQTLKILRAWTEDLETIARAEYATDDTYRTAARAIARVRLRQLERSHDGIPQEPR